jgi:hypothetical protein
LTDISKSIGEELEGANDGVCVRRTLQKDDSENFRLFYEIEIHQERKRKRLKILNN